MNRPTEWAKEIQRIRSAMTDLDGRLARILDRLENDDPGCTPRVFASAPNELDELGEE